MDTHSLVALPFEERSPPSGADVDRVVAALLGRGLVATPKADALALDLVRDAFEADLRLEPDWTVIAQCSQRAARSSRGPG